MLNLGQQVLRKIQNLLLKTDKKNFKEQMHINKSKSKIQNSQIKPSQVKQKKINASTTNQDNKQNICSHRIQQLYLNHFIKQKKLLNRNLENLEEEVNQLKNFKVENKKSKFLIEKASRKPIYERTPQIIKKKQQSVQKIKYTIPKRKQTIEQEQAWAKMQQNRKKYAKLTKEQFQKIMEEMKQRNIARLEKSQMKKLIELSEKSIPFLEKPLLSSTGKAWWQKKRLKKNLSTNVFERFTQYENQKKQKWDKYLEKRRVEQTPFTPRISQNTRQIAKKSLSKRSFLELIPRSHSCNLLSKKDESLFIENTDQSANQNTSQNKMHNKSSTTMQSSRNAHLEKRFG